MTNTTRSLALLTILALAGCAAPAGVEQARVTLDQHLPPANGAQLETKVVEVSYGPGGSSAPHSHSCAVVGHVTEGRLRTQSTGQPSRVYHAGESFYEAPHAVHQVSANASMREAVKFIAVFICDHPAPHTAAVPDNAASDHHLSEATR